MKTSFAVIATLFAAASAENLQNLTFATDSASDVISVEVVDEPAEVAEVAEENPYEVVGMSLLGGYSETMPVAKDSEEYNKFVGFKYNIENQLKTGFQTFEPVSYSQKVVAGMMYKIDYKIGNNKILKVEIFVPLPSASNQIPTVMEHTIIEEESNGAFALGASAAVAVAALSLF